MGACRKRSPRVTYTGDFFRFTADGQLHSFGLSAETCILDQDAAGDARINYRVGAWKTAYPINCRVGVWKTDNTAERPFRHLWNPFREPIRGA